MLTAINRAATQVLATQNVTTSVRRGGVATVAGGDLHERRERAQQPKP